MYVDEAGVENTLAYAYGWSEKGTRYLAERLGHRTQRTSVAAAWCRDENGQGKVLSPLMFEGYCNSAVIEAWFEQHLIHELEPGQVVILDNASFHRRAQLSEIVAQVGCTLLMLPPYSPDLNKIEPGAPWADGIRSKAASFTTHSRSLSSRKSHTLFVASNKTSAIQLWPLQGRKTARAERPLPSGCT